ncbi:MAG: 2Fe-2S iron-sulfur cluster binding domain-containing protein [Sphingobium sp.]|uniref:2Fe-2S iron-sulfur cluster-binding protein n=1 Tax=Sphingobium sp. TaxID=1912891 RepID=UPI001A2E16E5|nr:2Fe-2S iron-sulfur cluster-binding protein [Sphingobium sp.]MBJ7442813.1 2Fe-2S iron-sulfur cluster binding domain-containing protein [Sphingobium sp.]
MPEILVTDRAGQQTAVEATTDRTLMEIIRDAGFDDMVALCGGCCACATCHIHVDPAFADSLPPISADENDLLDTSPHRTAGSRLACQLSFTEAMNGLRVAIAAED